MEQTAEDDAERARIRARLYAPPPGAKAAGRRGGHPATTMTRAESVSLAAQIEAEDRQFTRSTAR